MNVPEWVVLDVKANEDYTLLLTFAHGEQKLYDARPLLDKPIFSLLKNPAFFLCAKASGGSVVWSDDIDIAPEHLYEKGRPVSGGGKGEQYEQ